MKDIKSYIIGFLTATCIFLLMGFEDYDRDAVTFSRQEMNIIKDNLNNIVATDRLIGREETEFLEKIKIVADNDTAD